MAVDWLADDWGHGRVHQGLELGDVHNASEDAAERSRG